MYASLGLNELKSMWECISLIYQNYLSNNDKTKNVYILVGYAVSIIADIIFFIQYPPGAFYCWIFFGIGYFDLVFNSLVHEGKDMSLFWPCYSYS